MSRPRRFAKRFSATTILIGMMLAAGVAFAAWTATGSGSGYARAGSAVNLTTTDVSATTLASLYPGANGNVKIQINNANPYPVKVTDVTGSGAITSDVAACDASTVTFTNQTGQNLAVPASSNATFTLNGAVHMDAASADNDCQGAVFTIPVSLAGVSQ